MTLADAGLVQPTRFGIEVVLPTRTNQWTKEIRRAEGDGSGGPVGGTTESLAVVGGAVDLFTDVGQYAPLDATKTYLYSYRFVRPNGATGTWSDWGPEQKPTDLTGQLGSVQSPPATVDLSIDESTGEVRMQVTSNLGVQSIRYATSTSDYPTNATAHAGTAVDTDSQGGADVDPVATLTRQQTVYVTVLFYRQLSGSGSYVATGRASRKYGVSEGRDPSEQSAVNLMGADAGPEQSGTGVTFHTFEGFEDGGSNLSSLNLEPGDRISIQAEVKSETGADSVNLAMVFQDSSGSTTGTGGTSGADSSTFTGAVNEDVEIPAGTVNIWLRGRNNDNTETAYIRRAMLNKGPVAAPYTDPPPVDAENLLPFSAILDKTVGTAGGAVTDWIALADMGLSPGEVISVSQTFEASAGDTYETEVEINDADDGSGTNVFDERTGEVTGGGRSRFHGIVIPSGGAAIRILGQDVGGPTNTATSSKRMLNRGARAAPFTAPSFREFLDDAFSIWRDLGSQSARVGDIVERIRDSGHADSGFGREDTGGVPRKMPKFPTPRSGLADGETISYGPFDAPPNWSHRQDGYSYQPDSSEWSTPASFDANAPQARRFLLEGVGEGSSTVRAQLQQLGTPTGRSDQWSATSILDTVGETQDSPALSNLPAVNNEFTVRYYWEVTGQDFSDEGPVPIDVTEIEVEVYGVDGSTGSPTLVATDNFQVSGVDPNVTLSGYREVTLTASDVADSGSDFFRLKLTKMEAVSGDIGPDSSSHVDGVDQGLSRDDTEAPGPGISWSTQSKITAPMTSTSQEVFVALNLTDPV